MPSPLTSSPEDRAGAMLTIDLAALVENWRNLKRRVAATCDMGAVVGGRTPATGSGAECFEPKNWLALRIYRIEVPSKGPRSAG